MPVPARGLLFGLARIDRGNQSRLSRSRSASSGVGRGPSQPLAIHALTASVSRRPDVRAFDLRPADPDRLDESPGKFGKLPGVSAREHPDPLRDNALSKVRNRSLDFLCRVDGDVAVPIPHRPGRAEFPHPVLHDRDSLAAAYPWAIFAGGKGRRLRISLRRADGTTL